MKNLKDIILEKLILNKDSKQFNKKEYSYQELVDKINSETDLNITIEYFSFLNSLYGITTNDIEKNLCFIDISNDEKEHNFYYREIYSKIDFTTRNNGYILELNDKGIFLNYLNTSVGSGELNEFRYVYINIKENNYKKPYIFKVSEI